MFWILINRWYFSHNCQSFLCQHCQALRMGQGVRMIHSFCRILYKIHSCPWWVWDFDPYRGSVTLVKSSELSKSWLLQLETGKNNSGHFDLIRDCKRSKPNAGQGRPLEQQKLMETMSRVQMMIQECGSEVKWKKKWETKTKMSKGVTVFLALSFVSWVIWGEALNLSGSHFFICKMGIIWITVLPITCDYFIKWDSGCENVTWIGKDQLLIIITTTDSNA